MTKAMKKLTSSQKFKDAGAVARVWMICNLLHAKARKDVIAACVEAKINVNTARTQYQQWFAEATEA